MGDSKFRNEVLEYSSTQDDEMVTSLLAPINNTARTKGAEAAEGDLWDLWAAIIAAASPEKNKALVKLVRSIKANDAGDVKAPDTWSGALWQDLPFLGPALREQWNQAPPEVSKEYWTSLNGLVATLTAAELHDGSLFGIWVLRDCLETENSEKGDQTAPDSEVLSTSLPAAVQWLVESGKYLKQLSDAGKQYGSGPDPARPGQLAQKKRVQTGLNIGRWQFWQSRLAELRDDEQSTAEIKSLAKQGIEAMNSASQS